MVQASVLGLIDFRMADPLSSKWWKKLRLTLDQLENNNLVHYYRLYYDYNLAVLSRDNITAESSRNFFKDTEKKIHQIANILRPWDKADPTQSQQAKVESLSKAWSKQFGDINDPKTQAAIDETVRLLGQMSARKPTNAR